MEVCHEEQQTETLVLTEDGMQLTAFWSFFLCRNNENGRFDPIFVMENIIPFIDKTFNYKIVDKNEWQWNCYEAAFYIPMSNEIIIRSDVYEGALNGNAMDVITVAHEVIHCIQSILMRFLRALNCVDFKTELCKANSKEMKNHEIQTDRITKLVLCPDYLIKGMSEDEIIQHYFARPLIQVVCGILKAAGIKVLENLNDVKLIEEMEVDKCAV